MTKREAQELVDRGDLTWGHLKHYITESFDREMFAMSAVNAGLTVGQSLDILRAAVEPRDDNELVISSRYAPRRNASGFAIAVNVIRETLPLGRN